MLEPNSPIKLRQKGFNEGEEMPSTIKKYEGVIDSPPRKKRADRNKKNKMLNNLSAKQSTNNSHIVYKEEPSASFIATKNRISNLSGKLNKS